MKCHILTTPAAVLLATSALMSSAAHGQTHGTVEDIRFVTESEESAKLAEKVANLIIAHGLGKSFDRIFIIANKEDEDLAPIMILKLSEKGEALPVKGNEKIEKLVEDVTFLMAQHYKDQKVEVWVQNREHANLLKADYDPADNRIMKKVMGSE